MEFLKKEYLDREFFSPEKIHWKVTLAIGFVGFIITSVPIVLAESFRAAAELSFFPLVGWMLNGLLIAGGSYYISRSTLKDCFKFATANFFVSTVFAALSALIAILLTETQPIFALIGFKSLPDFFLLPAVIYAVVNFFDRDKLLKGFGISVPAALIGQVISNVLLSVILGEKIAFSVLANLDLILLVESVVDIGLAAFALLYVFEELSEWSSESFSATVLASFGFLNIFVAVIVGMIITVFVPESILLAKMGLANAYNWAFVIAGLIFPVVYGDLWEVFLRGYSSHS